jgi:hypothetical protein
MITAAKIERSEVIVVSGDGDVLRSIRDVVSIVWRILQAHPPIHCIDERLLAEPVLTSCLAASAAAACNQEQSNDCEAANTWASHLGCTGVDCRDPKERSAAVGE